MRIRCACLLLIFPLISVAQQTPNLVIEGAVIGAKTRQGIPFASVRIQNKPVGVTASEEGKFRFIIPPTYRNDTIEISSLGFNSRSLVISSFNQALYHTVVLEEAVVKLAEVKIMAVSPTEILRRAIRQMDRHFDNNPYQMESFFRIAVRKDSDFIGLLDAAIQLRDKGFNHKNSMSANLVQLRKIVDKPNWLPGSNWQFRSPAISFEQEFDRMEKGILAMSKAKKFWELQLEDQVYQDDDLIYILRATAKRFAVYHPYYHAKLRIRARDYAILQIDYDYGKNIQAYAKAFPAANPFGGKMSDQTELRFENKKGSITFSEYQGKLYLSREYYQETGRITNQTTHTAIAYEGSFEIFVNQITRGSFPEAAHLINKWDDVFNLAEQYDSTYWANYNKPIDTRLYQLAKANLEKKGNLEEQFKKYTSGLNTAAQLEKQLLTETKETEHFLFFYHPADSSTILEIAKKLEDNYKRVLNDLQVTDQPRVSVKVYPDLLAYHQGIGNPYAPAWEVGAAQGPDEFKIVSPNKPGPAHTYQSIINATVHEFTHCVHANMVTHLPTSQTRWLSESIACYEANQFIDPATLKYLRKGQYPSLAEINADTQRGLVYELGYVLVKYMKERWGMKAVVEILRSGGEMEPVLGISEAQFEKDWHTFIKDTYLADK